jgi:hypothetical protein
MAAQQRNGDRPRRIVVGYDRHVHMRSAAMKKFVLIAAAAVALIASPALSQSMSQQVKQSEGVMKSQQQYRGAPRGRSFRLAFNRMGHWGHHRHHRHHHR